jgi:hypothetical protein
VFRAKEVLDRELSGANREAEAAFTKAAEEESAKEASEEAAASAKESGNVKK